MIPITLKYCVTEIINVEKSQNINDVNFICVEHLENGKRMFTAFIGSGENNNDKISVKISPILLPSLFLIAVDKLSFFIQTAVLFVPCGKAALHSVGYSLIS